VVSTRRRSSSRSFSTCSMNRRSTWRCWDGSVLLFIGDWCCDLSASLQWPARPARWLSTPSRCTRAWG